MNYLNKYLASFLMIAALFFAASSRPALAQSVPPLGAAESFAALAGTTLTATGSVVISGNVGVSPGSAVIGFPPGIVVNGQIYTGVGSLAGPAQASALDAYNNLKGQACLPANNLTGKILGETPGFLTLSPGVYCFDTSAQLNATLTLNDGGDPNAIFIFQIGTTLTTASSSQVLMSSGGRGKNVYWQVGTSATIGTSTIFRGNIIAKTSITFTTSASTTGRIFALEGAATIDSTSVDAVPTGIQFSSSTYGVAESGASIQITVLRTGDTTQAATVDYVTSDDSDPSLAVRCDVVNTGIASSRCDFTTAIGRLSFAANETSKTFTVLINQDSYLEGLEALTLTLSNPTGGAVLGVPSTATLQITDDATEPATNAIDDTGDFVRQHYLDFLNREKEAGGFNAWVNLLNGCAPGNTACDRVTVSQSFFGSPEFKSKGYFATRFYFAAFNRNPLFLEFSGDLSRLNGATPAESDAAKASFPAEFTQRAEFHTTFDSLSNAQYVDTLIARTGVAYSNRDQLVADLNSATKTRAQVLNEIVEATQFVQNATTFNRAFVLAEYFGYLRRNPETPGFNMWIVYLQANPGDFRTMVNGFMNSIEYRLRFGTP